MAELRARAAGLRGKPLGEPAEVVSAGSGYPSAGSGLPLPRLRLRFRLPLGYTRMRMRTPAVLRLLALTALAACGPAADRDLLPVDLPDPSGMHPAVQAQLRGAEEALGAGRRSERAAAFGALGMLLMAGEYLEAAEPSLRNARRLDPSAFRWTYYLAHLLWRQGDLAQAARYFEAARRLRPDDFPTLIWLASTYLNLGLPGEAAPVLARARSVRPGAAVVRYHEGHAAAAAGDHARAVEHFTAALRLEPNAGVVHYPLAMAYRALGDLELAEFHLQRGGPGAGDAAAGMASLVLSDPLMAELSTVLRSPRVHRELALAADGRGDFAEAARQFRQAIDLEPDDPLLHLSRAMALDRAGDARAAVPALDEALRLDPDLAQAHYVLGTLLERAGRDTDAIERFTAAAARDPGSAETQLRLANALRRTGRFEASLAPYRRVIEATAPAVEARFGEALALVRLARHREARARLEEALRLQPGNPTLATALARLLAASPDGRVRNGRRALTLIRAVVADHKTTSVAETMAMALAELGEFRGAVEWQQVAIDVARDAGRPDLAERMGANLDGYRRGRPCRTPWRDDEPEQRPGPPVEPGLLGPAPPA